MTRRRRGMARAGEVLENPVSGQRIVFRKTAADTDDEFRLASPPWPVQRALFAVLAPAGGLLGYRASYPEYGG
jgi:hypothetical protein